MLYTKLVTNSTDEHRAHQFNMETLSLKHEFTAIAMSNTQCTAL